MTTRSVRFLALPAIALLAACTGDGRTDTTTAPQPTELRGSVGAASLTSCTAGVGDTATIRSDLVTLFGAGSPNFNSARGKLDNIYAKVASGPLAEAQNSAVDLTGFILKKNAQSPLPGGTALAESVTERILCFTGLDASIDADDSFFINPLDEEQIITDATGQNGARFRFDPVTVPTIVTFTRINPAGFPVPGTGPLGTQLDQYPGFIDISVTASVANPLKEPVTVAVCPTVVIPTAVLARARLGHFAEPGRFRVEPDGGPGFLSCVSVASNATPRWLGDLASLVLPKPLHAAVFGGGITGNVNEFSPFGIVDPVMMVGGGITGNVNEFRIDANREPGVNLSIAGARESRTTSLALGAQGANGAACPPVEAPIGTPLPPGCRPALTVTTPLGRAITGLAVDWSVAADGSNGTIAAAPTPTTCSGSFGASARTTTGAKGGVGICWTMGPTPGTEVVTATIGTGPGLAGATPEPASVTFEATALAPTALVFTQQPPASVVAGAPFGVQVTAVDKNGTTVLGWDGTVTLALNKEAFATGSTTAAASQGVATVSGLSITKAGTGYEITASATAFGSTFSRTSSSFDVGADVPATMAKVGWVENQLVQPGALLPAPPVVRLADRFGNVVPNAPVQWLGGLEGGATTTPLTPTTIATSAEGRSTIQWNLGTTSADLVAQYVQGNTVLSETFRAAGISPLRTELSCSLLGGRDPINPSSNQALYDISVPGFGQRGISQLQLFLSATGSANADLRTTERYEVRVQAFQNRRVNGTDVWTQVGSTTQSFALRGNASADEPTTFSFASPIPTGNARTYFRLTVTAAPGNSTVLYNVGPCATGANGSCPPVQTTFPRGCLDVQQNPVGTPGTVRRRGVAVVVRTQ